MGRVLVFYLFGSDYFRPAHNFSDTIFAFFCSSLNISKSFGKGGLLLTTFTKCSVVDAKKGHF